MRMAKKKTGSDPSRAILELFTKRNVAFRSARLQQAIDSGEVAKAVAASALPLDTVVKGLSDLDIGVLVAERVAPLSGSVLAADLRQRIEAGEVPSYGWLLALTVLEGQDAVPLLLELLRTAKPAVRMAAAGALPDSCLASDEVQGLLIDAMVERYTRAPSQDPRGVAAGRLSGRCLSADAMAKLLEALDAGLARWKDADAVPVELAAEVLATSADPAGKADVVRRLDRVLQSPAGEARDRQASALFGALLPVCTPDIVARAWAQLEIALRASRETASESLGWIGETAGRIVVEKGNQDHWRVLAGHLTSFNGVLSGLAFEAAIRLPDAEAIENLGRTLLSPAPPLVHWVFQYDSHAYRQQRRLELYKNPAWFDVLRPVLEVPASTDADEVFHERALRIAGHVEDPRMLSLLVRYAQGCGRISLMRAVAEALGRRKHPDAAPVLLELLQRSGGAAYSGVAGALENTGRDQVLGLVREARTRAKGDIERSQFAMLDETLARE
jgi:hypothetical protein